MGTSDAKDDAGVPGADGLSVAQSMPADLNRAVMERKVSGLDAEIRELLARYAAAYNRQDYAALLELWDRDDPDVFYIAEEIDPPMHGWELIEAYFNRPGVLDGIRCRYSEVVANLLAPGLAIATYKLHFDLKVRNMKAMSGFDRVVAVFRRRPDGWKMARYAEAPQPPMTMIRRFCEMAGEIPAERQRDLLRSVQTLQEMAVPDDFAAWLDRQAPRRQGRAVFSRTTRSWPAP